MNGPSDLRLAGPLVAVAVLVIVAAQLRNHLAAEPFAQVEHVCGLCGADWTPVASLLIIAALVAIAAHTVSFVKPQEVDDDE